MPGVRTFAGTQLGLEATAGTAVAATEVWNGPVIFPEDTRVRTRIEANIGIAGGADQSAVTGLKAKIALPKTVLNFEQPYPFLSLKSVPTGAADGPGTDKLYAFACPTTAAPTVKAMTIEGFDDQQEYEAEYCLFSELKLSSKYDDFAMIEATGFGRQVAASTKTPALTLPATLEPILHNLSKIYIDAIGGTIGTTQKSNTLFAVDMTIHTFQKEAPPRTGNKYFDFAKFAPPSKDALWVTGKLSIEHDAIATAQFALFQADTPQLLRIQYDGSSLGTPGTIYSKKALRIDMPIKWTSYMLGDLDGNDTVELGFESRYNLTAGIAPTFTFVNERAAL